MAGFLYFVPSAVLEKRAGWELADAAAVGLGYAFDRDDEILSRETRQGPDGGPGMLLARGGDMNRLLCQPDKQTWRRVPRRPADRPVWVGMWNEDRPGPVDLVRKAAMAGHAVSLGDGQSWICPTARAWDAAAQRWGERVSRVLDWDESGRRIFGDVSPTHRELWAAASAWWDARLAADIDGEMVLVNQAIDSDTVVAALSFNYLLGRAEIGLLGLLDETSEIRVLDALIDWPTYLGWWQKKSAEEVAGSKPDDGLPASTPDTVPPSPISG